MNYFLFGGAVNVGKTEAVVRIVYYLTGKGYRILVGNVPPLNQPSDFCVLLEGKNLKGKKIRIIVNSAADIEQNIDDLASFCLANNHDIVISAVRCEGYPIRKYFY